MSGIASAAFRVDGSVRIGTGHVMRCLALADALALRGFGCLFVARTVDDALAQRIERSGHRLARLTEPSPPAGAAQGVYGEWLGTTQEHDAQASVETIAERGVTPPIATIVDHYGLGEVWERIVGGRLGAPILAIDDLDRRHACDILLDTTFGKAEETYDGLVPQACQRLVGSAFALLRPDFARRRPVVLERRDRAFAENLPVRDLLVSMGGADEGDATDWMLDGLEPLAERHDLRLHVLVGASYPHGERLTARAALSGGRITVHREIWEMADFLSAMDLCIGASGSSTWERCCVGLPTVNVVLADNQRAIAAALSEAGAVVDGGVFDATAEAVEWGAYLVEPLLEGKALDTLSRKGRGVVDGEGVQRVIEALIRATEEARL